MKTGKANYEKTQYKKKLHIKVKDKPVIARIVGPLGDNVEKGAWFKFHSAVFGYKNKDGKARPFESPLQKKDKGKTIVTPCAATERVNDLKAKLEQAKTEGNTALVNRLNALVGPNKAIYNVDNNNHMNVILLDGSIGELAIRYKHKLKLDEEIGKLRAKNIDPLSDDNGRFFIFSKVPNGRDTLFDVEPYYEEIDMPNVGKVKREVVHKITPEIEKRFDTEAWDLDKIYIKVTAEECAQIVNESNLLTGISPACDRIFDDKWAAERAAREAAKTTSSSTASNTTATNTAPSEPQQDEGDEYCQDEASNATQPAATTVTNTPNSAATSTTTTNTPNSAAATTTTTPAAATQPAAALPTGATTQPAAATQADDIAAMGDDEFFAQMGVNTSKTA